MTARTTDTNKNSASLIIEGVTIVLLFSTVFFPPIGLIGLLFMKLWTKWQKWVKILIAVPILLLCFWIVTYLFLFRPFQVIGESMMPNFQDGEYVLAQIYHGQNSIRRNDVVIFISPQNSNIYLIKRVIALPNDKVTIQNGQIFLNGTLLNESDYLTQGVKTDLRMGDLLSNGQQITVPYGTYFVLGDDRSVSNDSRKFGFVPRDTIVGKVLVCYWNCRRDN